MIPFFNWDYVPENEFEENNGNEENYVPENNNGFEGNNASQVQNDSEEINFVDGKVFKSRDEVIQWVQNVGRSFGYIIVIKRSKENRNVLFKCDRGGISNSQSTIRKTGSKKINCPFSVEAKHRSLNDCWVFRVINLEHNHEPCLYLEGHAYARRFKENELQLVTDLSKKNVKPRDILSSLKKENSENVSTLKTVYNARQKIRLTDKDGRSQVQVLMSFLQKKGYIFHTPVDPSTNKLEEIFFAHPTSLAKWRAFPHVLLIDATYKTNRYGLPLLEMVGVSSTNMTFCVAFVFMDKEMDPNYTWSLDCLKSTLDGCVFPRVIVTDRELALMSAYNKVFLDARGILCRWHISRNIIKKCKPTIRNHEDWVKFNKTWSELQNSETEATYMNNFIRLQNVLAEYIGVFNYLNNTWLDPYKEMFVSAWINRDLNFGNDTTNRVESQHAKLKKYLESTQCDLVTALNSIHDVIQSQDTAIKGSLEESRIVIIHRNNIPHFQQLLGFVSNYALELMFNEYRRSEKVGVFSENCGCHLRSSRGLPCAHEQAMFMCQGRPIPLEVVDVFWKKLDLTSCVSFQDDDVTCEVEVEQFKEDFQKQARSGKFGYLRKLKEIMKPSATLLGEPSVHKSTRGRPSSKKTQNPRPSQQQQPRRPNYSTYIPYIEQIPMIFHPYVLDTIDVSGDGNCGFRAVAVAMGRAEEEWREVRLDLIEELEVHWGEYVQMMQLTYAIEIHHRLNVFKSPAPQGNWWIMPECAKLVANRYNVMLHVIALNVSSTSLPMWAPPPSDETQRAISIVHVNDNHFVVAKMIGEYPIPTINPFWHHYRYEEASPWIAPYMQRVHAYNDYLEAMSQPTGFQDLDP